ncbi:hypothetical protein BDV26DRAFT_37906 [Aspergillus bertholletiae]|uniref:Uncharacterized protein n=1 Tax=Aspergillus bertholletiae TaxID=1226010 RepID=A0A5N7BJX5_9EURO|nr:hypothetical protein BDV26DRAFT_37906 [Aspergillus bertholletiae]
MAVWQSTNLRGIIRNNEEPSTQCQRPLTLDQHTPRPSDYVRSDFEERFAGYGVFVICFFYIVLTENQSSSFQPFDSRLRLSNDT